MKLFLILFLVLLTSSIPKETEESFGIDVSHHNGKIDWQEVKKNHKLLFVYVKATEGATYVDPQYSANIAGVSKAGFTVGSYHFFRMTSSAHSQFENFKRTVDIKKQKCIPMVDVEKSDNHSQKELQDSLNVFISLVKQYFGKDPMIYATNRSYNELLGKDYNKYHLYIGRYGDRAPVIPGKGTYTIWQFTEEGKLKGIPKLVDKARFNNKYSIKNILLSEIKH
ncbi:MAG: glycosyl hydrolase family 25 [Muribaculaceae bacterium]|nr:glycosyl hydrolase family 25 [Muribaculaceae bacterium]MDE6754921.1 glycosyl hydrolase family 25 [Muribaculaceae bacterium]